MRGWLSFRVHVAVHCIKNAATERREVLVEREFSDASTGFFGRAVAAAKREKADRAGEKSAHLTASRPLLAT
jgi:hypothetical protein